MPYKHLYHIGLKDNINAKYAILPGDPGRVEKIAQYLDDPQKIGDNREYRSYMGYIENESVIVMSTGIGGPSASIALEELAQVGVDTVIRVGTCGGMQQNIIPGDLIIADSAVRMEGTSREYLPIEYPAASNFYITSALEQASRKLDFPFHLGTVQSKDSFYGQHSPNRMPVKDTLLSNWNAYIKAGCLASEMECSAIFSVAKVLGLNAGSVLLCIGNQERVNKGIIDENVYDTTKAILTAVEAIKILIQKS